MMTDLPDYIDVCGQLGEFDKAKYQHIPVNVDFRLWIALEEAVISGDRGRIVEACRALVPGLSSLTQAVFEGIMGFYALVNPYPFAGGQSGVRECGNKGKTGRWYDFSVDFGRLAGSFRAVYGIDLYRDSLHWGEFRVLMLNLPPECEFMRIAGYRLSDVSELPKSQKKHYLKLKAMYALDPVSGGGVFSSAAERDRDMLRRMEKIRKEMSEGG